MLRVVTTEISSTRWRRKDAMRGSLCIVGGDECLSLGNGNNLGGQGERFSRKTLCSLAAFLGDLAPQDTKMLLATYMGEDHHKEWDVEIILDVLEKSNRESIRGMLNEIGITQSTLRGGYTVHWSGRRWRRAESFDQRFHALNANLQLEDGYRLRSARDLPDDGIIHVESATHKEADELERQIDASRLDNTVKSNVKDSLEKSRAAFCGGASDPDGMLSHARKALDQLAEGIAGKPGCGWGSALKQLVSDKLITGKLAGREKGNSDEEFLTSAHRWISEGAHKNMPDSEEEKALFGRRMVLLMCLFLIRKFNGKY